MPFKSRAQERFMYSQHPGLAKEFSAATPKGVNLPEYVPGSKAAGKAKPKSGLGKWI